MVVVVVAVVTEAVVEAVDFGRPYRAGVKSCWGGAAAAAAVAPAAEREEREKREREEEFREALRHRPLLPLPAEVVETGVDMSLTLSRSPSNSERERKERRERREKREERREKRERE